MKKRRFVKIKKECSLIALILLFILSLSAAAQDETTEAFSFIISGDQRHHAESEFHSPEFTLGGYQAIERVGKGDFMVVMGDIDPAHATDMLIEKVFGYEYPWYPVIGNHDIENPDDLAFLKSMNSADHLLPHIVSLGPEGCEETNYTFEWYGVHFIVIDVFFKTSYGRLKYTPIDTRILEWLEADLKRNQGKRIFVFGHKPVIAIPDMDNYSRRHLGEVLDRFPENELFFHQLLMKYGVTAYISGHTHAASWANINGVWHLNSGHIYGQEGDYPPQKLFSMITALVDQAKHIGTADTTVIRRFYESDSKEIKKSIFPFDPIPGINYKSMPDQEALRRLTQFYRDCVSDSMQISHYENLLWNQSGWRKSTFLKINIQNDSAVLEIYRDTDYQGHYELRYTQVLY